MSRRCLSDGRVKTGVRRCRTYEKKYISDEEHEKCRRVAEAFAELEDVDIVVIDVGRYGFVKLQYYTPPTGFENDFTFTDSKELFEDLYEEWLHTQLIALAREMNVNDIEYDDIYRRLTEEQHKELEEKKKVFAQRSGIVL